ncbi:MAG: hypothetical protein K6A43_12650 [Treponema sp.]|nr:hypothetical protein [Treponema sp.]
MKKDYYMHQKFLLDCDYEEVSLPDSSVLKNEFIQDFTESINLFDTDKEITRKVKLSYLLKEIDTRNDLSEFLNKTNFTDNLIIENDMKESKNPIIAEFQNTCLKAFYKQLKKKSFDIN